MALIGGTIGRMAIRAMLPQIVRMGLGGNAALREVQRIGYTMRRTDFLSFYRSAAGIERSRPYFAGVTRYNRPDPGRLEGINMGDAPNYRIWGKSTVYNTRTGRYETKYVSMYDDYLRSKDEYESEFLDRFGDRMAESEYVFVGMTFETMVKNEARL